MTEGKPSIWRREDEFKDTEIEGGFLRLRRTQMTRIERIIADFSGVEVVTANWIRWEGGRE